jgi:signal transduction histidine kinase
MFKSRFFGLIFSGISIVGFLLIWGLLQSELNKETRRSLELRIETAARVSSQNLESSNVRGLIELFGKEFADDAFRISKNGVDEFKIGKSSLFSICASKELVNFFPLIKRKATVHDEPYRIQICRKMPLLMFSPFAVFGLILIFAYLFYRFSKNAEKIAVEKFNYFVKENNLHLNPLRRLGDIFSVLDQLDAEVRRNKEITKEIAREDAFRVLAIQFVHDTAPWMSTLRTISDLEALDSEAKGLTRALAEQIAKKRKMFLARGEERSSESFGNSGKTILIKNVSERVLQEVFRLYKERYKTIEGLFLKADVHQDDPSHICGELDRLLDVVLSVVTNAFEAKKDVQPFPILNLKLWILGNSLCMDIEDKGVGIPSNVLGRLFQRAFTYNKSDGSGFGLWGARRTLAEWGGEISISSEIGQWTKVSIILNP